MNFISAIKLCFTKYADFNGRASRPEFWWFFLLTVICNLLLRLTGSKPLSIVFSLVIFLPSIAVTARRLHDINKSGWFQLWWVGGPVVLGVALAITSAITATKGSAFIGAAVITVIMMLGLFLMSIYYLAKAGDVGDNKYSEPPQ